MKINDYCYIKNNRKYGIGKVYSMLENNNVLVSFKTFMKMFSIGNVISSPNPIDLIEVGDYVNGKEITKIDNDGWLLFEASDMSNEICFKEKNIRTIVTKEQFSSMEYKI